MFYDWSTGLSTYGVCRYCFLKTHFAMPKTNAWKPIVLSLMLDEFDCVLYLDAGMELRAPLTEVRQRIQADGAGSSDCTARISCCEPGG